MSIDIVDLYISSNREYIKAKLVNGRVAKIQAPIKEKIIKDCLALQRYIFELYGFKVEEKDDKIVPYLFCNIVGWDPNDSALSLSTKSLLVHSSKLFPTLRDIKIRCRYWGSTYFRNEFEGNVVDEEILEDLINGIKYLYEKSFYEYQKSKDLSIVKKLFVEFYSKQKIEKKEIEIVPKIEKPPIKMMEGESGIEEIVEEELKPTKHKRKKARESKTLKIETQVQREPSIDEMKKEIGSYDFSPSKNFPLWWAHQKYLDKLKKEKDEKKIDEVTRLLYRVMKGHMTAEEYHKKI